MRKMKDKSKPYAEEEINGVYIKELEVGSEFQMF